ncbi:hypothetical protein NCC49_004810 [Naganishia albida]|nr:hypothetical protein NCC49_004810 [Naganishia albida]
MFSSPLPYTNDRYTQPLPPPVPPSPLRRHAQTYDARQTAVPPLNHTTSAPGNLEYGQPTSTYEGWTTADPSQSPRPIEDESSVMEDSFRRSLSLHSPPAAPEETEAERMVRMMSRRNKGRQSHTAAFSSIPMYEYQQQEEGPALQDLQHATPFRGAETLVAGTPATQQVQWEQHPQGASYQQYPPYDTGHQYPPPMDFQTSADYSGRPVPSSSRYSYDPSLHHAQTYQSPHVETTPPDHAKPDTAPTFSRARVTDVLYPDSTANSGTATPCPPYLPTPAQGETSYLDSIPFERAPPPVPEKTRLRPSGDPPEADAHGEGSTVRPSVGEVRMPRGEDYASIPSYGAYDSDESSDTYESAPVEERRRASFTSREEGDRRASFDVERRASVDAERRASAQIEQGTAGAGRATTTTTTTPTTGEGVHRSGTVASRVSYSVGDEAGMTVPVVPPKDVVAESVAEGEVRKEHKEKKTLGESWSFSEDDGADASVVFSYHPLPTTSETTAPVPTKSTLPPQIKLFPAPVSFQLLSTSLKRLLADLMISATTLFVPSASAYAASEQERPAWRVEVWVRTFALPVPLGQGRRMVGGGFRTMVGIEMDEITPGGGGGRPAVQARMSSTSSLALTRTRSSIAAPVEAPAVPKKPVATTQDATNALVPAFASSYVLRLRLTNALQVPFTAAQLVETLHRHYKYGQRIARSSTASVAPGTIEENAYSFSKMIDRAPGPVDEVTRLSKAHKLGRTTGAAAAATRAGGVAPVCEEDREDIQGQVGRKGFRYTVRKAVSKAVGVVQSEREETVEDDRAAWVTPFTG